MLSVQTIFQLAHLSNLSSNIPLDTQVKGISFNSQRVRQGDIFFALPGEKRHGIDFADSALQAGAAFIVSDRAHPQGIQVANPKELLIKLGKKARTHLKGPVIGVTGSAGKTSTKAMLATILEAEASPGNFNTPLALARVLIDTWLIGKTNENDILVLELGIDHVGEMATLVELAQPSHAFLTLIAPSHFGGLQNIQTVAREKGKLLEKAKCAWVSADALPLLHKAIQRKSFSYGLKGDDADVCGEIISSDAQGQVIKVLKREFFLPYAGKAMAKNAVGALTFAAYLEKDLDECIANLKRLELEPRRLQVHQFKDFYVIDDCYNSNPASAKAALETLGDFPRQHTVILGDMLDLGIATVELHRELGKFCSEADIDNIITFGDAARYIAMENRQARHYYDLDDVWYRLKDLLETNLTGTVLVKASRGMELERLVDKLLSYVS